MPPPLILFVENDLDFLATRKAYLAKAGYRVVPAINSQEAHQIVRRESVSLVILDIRLIKDEDDRDTSGLTLAEELPPDLRKIILTDHESIENVRRSLRPGVGGRSLAFDFVSKDEGPQVLLEAIRSALAGPYETHDKWVNLSMKCVPYRPIDLAIDGAIQSETSTLHPLWLDVPSIARRARQALSLDWRFNVKETGKELYRQVFVAHPEVLTMYSSAMGLVDHSHNLHLSFRGPRDSIQLPMEFLHPDSEVPSNEQYLVLQHPVSRMITDIIMKRRPLSPTSLNTLRERGNVLRILLIASQTSPPLPEVDQEIDDLNNHLSGAFRLRNVQASVELLSGHDATYERVREALRQTPFHIIHYAGHGRFVDNSAERSCLFFRDKSGNIKAMPISELNLLLQDSDHAQFLFLSCCWGSETASALHLVDNDFLGIADGIVQAGVPAVLGYRRPVADRSGRLLAAAFYESLARQGQLDTALWEARCTIAGRDRNDVTWMSPVLVMQGW